MGKFSKKQQVLEFIWCVLESPFNLAIFREAANDSHEIPIEISIQEKNVKGVTSVFIKWDIHGQTNMGILFKKRDHIKT